MFVANGLASYGGKNFLYRKFFPPYDASPLATNKLLSNHPGVKKSMASLQNKISTTEMQKLNYEADGKGVEPAVVALLLLIKIMMLF